MDNTSIQDGQHLYTGWTTPLYRMDNTSIQVGHAISRKVAPRKFEQKKDRVFRYSPNQCCSREFSHRVDKHCYVGSIPHDIYTRNYTGKSTGWALTVLSQGNVEEGCNTLWILVLFLFLILLVSNFYSMIPYYFFLGKNNIEGMFHITSYAAHPLPIKEEALLSVETAETVGFFFGHAKRKDKMWHLITAGENSMAMTSYTTNAVFKSVGTIIIYLLT